VPGPHRGLRRCAWRVGIETGARVGRGPRIGARVVHQSGKPPTLRFRGRGPPAWARRDRSGSLVELCHNSAVFDFHVRGQVRWVNLSLTSRGFETKVCLAAHGSRHVILVRSPMRQIHRQDRTRFGSSLRPDRDREPDRRAKVNGGRSSAGGAGGSAIAPGRNLARHDKGSQNRSRGLLGAELLHEVRKQRPVCNHRGIGFRTKRSRPRKSGFSVFRRSRLRRRAGWPIRLFAWHHQSERRWLLLRSLAGRSVAGHHLCDPHGPVRPEPVAASVQSLDGQHQHAQPGSRLGQVRFCHGCGHICSRFLTKRGPVPVGAALLPARWSVQGTCGTSSARQRPPDRKKPELDKRCGQARNRGGRRVVAEYMAFLCLVVTAAR